MSTDSPAAGRLHRVRVDAFALKEVLAAHAAAEGKEPCGILVGRASATGIDVVACWPVSNSHVDPTRAFLLPAAEVTQAQSRARERGLDVVGTWHGHLRGDATLSGADVAGLVAASTGPGADGVPAARPHAFLVSGGGLGKNVVVRAYVRAGPEGAAEVPVKRLPPD